MDSKELDSSSFVGGKLSKQTRKHSCPRRNGEKAQILHYQGFDAHMSDDHKFQMHFSR